ncbi:MAG: Holliday junction branch migration protein RuvA [Verrucomicrobium sp.]|nr:Holliday junction branch migration protein RuvA [Verrucomicrobium sp.]
MIAYLKGTLVEAWPTHAVVEVGGLGYEVQVSLATYEKLPAAPAPVHLLTHLQVKEDAHTLFGFVTTEERDLFNLLVNHVSGIGPKSALAILSATSPAQFRAAVVSQDLALLSKIKGVGKKTAERIVLELRDRLGVSAAWEAASARNSQSPAEQQVTDAVLALVSLGYKQADAAKAAAAVRARTPQAETEELIREALKHL